MALSIPYDNNNTTSAVGVKVSVGVNALNMSPAVKTDIKFTT